MLKGTGRRSHPRVGFPKRQNSMSATSCGPRQRLSRLSLQNSSEPITDFVINKSSKQMRCSSRYEARTCPGIINSCKKMQSGLL